MPTFVILLSAIIITISFQKIMEIRFVESDYFYSNLQRPINHTSSLSYTKQAEFSEIVSIMFSVQNKEVFHLLKWTNLNLIRSSINFF